MPKMITLGIKEDRLIKSLLEAIDQQLTKVKYKQNISITLQLTKEQAIDIKTLNFRLKSKISGKEVREMIAIMKALTFQEVITASVIADALNLNPIE